MMTYWHTRNSGCSELRIYFCP